MGVTLGAGLVFDEAYVYWVNDTSAGSIMRVPKTGGTASIIAREVSPIAIAVDSTSVYWSDVAA